MREKKREREAGKLNGEGSKRREREHEERKPWSLEEEKEEMDESRTALPGGSNSC